MSVSISFKLSPTPELIRHIESERCSIDTLWGVCQTRHFDLLVAAADNRHTPAEALASLIRIDAAEIEVPEYHWSTADDYTTVQRWAKIQLCGAVAANPSTPTLILVDLSLCEDEGIRGEIVRNPMTPAIALARLARAAEVSIAGAAVKHPNCTTRILHTVTGRPEASFLRALANSPACSPVIFGRLGIDRHETVRLQVAHNVRCPVHTLALLMGDSSARVRKAAVNNPALPGYLKIIANLGR